MIVDLVPADRLPWIIVWLVWNFYAYKISLLILLTLFISHYWVYNNNYSRGKLPV